jgi:hypothetical protein
MKWARAYSKICNTLNLYSFGHDVSNFHGGHLLQDVELMIAELCDYRETDEGYNPFADVETEKNTRRKLKDLRDCAAKVNFADVEASKKEFLAARKDTAGSASKNRWILVDGEKKPVDLGLRRDWEGRIEDEDYYDED